MRIGVICPSEIAIRRFMPALRQSDCFTFCGLGIFSREERLGSEKVSEETFREALEGEKRKAQVFVDQYGGKIFGSYTEVVSSSEIDAVYIPLPPALHYRWAKLALENGKHVLVEKPATVNACDTLDLIDLADKKGLALHENYMFTFHEQIRAIKQIINSGEIGDVRLYRISFGFPRRAANDFRYKRELGGGALIDAGGYTLKLATLLLGESAEMKYAQSNYLKEFDVDLFGSAALVNSDGVTAQISFGMDNDYRCELEVWGSLGTLTSGRVLTAPVGFVPTATISKGNEKKLIELPSDDAFLKSIRHFYRCINVEETRHQNYSQIATQSRLVDRFKELAGWT